MKILVAEDEKRMNRALCEILRREKYEVDGATDGVTALDMIGTGVYDLIILDVMMPGMNGFDVVIAARRSGVRTPVLMLTAKSELEDKVMGLDSGADDYLTKPFLTNEFLARIRALLRRQVNSANGSLEFGDLSLDVPSSTLSCTATGQSVRLGEKELRILEYMIANQGRVLAREQIAVKIWGYESEAEYNNVEVYMTFTRKKLNFIGSKCAIKSVRGVGYELRYDDVP